ncbi:MAG TPA: alpha/beta hydrolase-fold protein, partial [Pyrinomonadaceae bacterium]|nr:alpha/beta hydrolase-fold protein [Pyrinomonadaceae bacterium]
MKLTPATETLFIVLLTMLGVNSVQAQQPASAPTPTPASENKLPGSADIIQSSLHSAILNEERRVIIHLPRNYSQDTSRKYPVMYVLDGTSQDQHTADKITVLSDAGLIPSAIVVGLPNTRGNRERDQTPPYMRRDVNDENSPFGAADKFLSFVEKELIPFVEGNYRTSGYKTLSGNSRGGLFVLYSLLEKPDLFQARFCYSTPVWRFDNLMVNRTAEFLRPTSGLNNFLYLSVGEKETEQMIGGFNKVVEALKKNRKKGFRWIADYTPFAVHQNNALVSTSKGLVEWGKYLKEMKNRTLRANTYIRRLRCSSNIT